MPLEGRGTEDDRRFPLLAIELEAGKRCGHAVPLRLNSDHGQPRMQPEPNILSDKLDPGERGPEARAEVGAGRGGFPGVKFPVDVTRDGGVGVVSRGGLDAPGKGIPGVPPSGGGHGKLVPPIRLPKPNALPLRVVVYTILPPEPIQDVLVHLPDEETRLGQRPVRIDALAVLEQEVLVRAVSGGELENTARRPLHRFENHGLVRTGRNLLDGHPSHHGLGPGPHVARTLGCRAPAAPPACPHQVPVARPRDEPAASGPVEVREAETVAELVGEGADLADALTVACQQRLHGIVVDVDVSLPVGTGGRSPESVGEPPGGDTAEAPPVGPDPVGRPVALRAPARMDDGQDVHIPVAGLVESAPVHPCRVHGLEDSLDERSDPARPACDERRVANRHLLAREPGLLPLEGATRHIDAPARDLVIELGDRLTE